MHPRAMNEHDEEKWEAVFFDLDATCFGFVLSELDSGVYAYERSGPSRTLVPCFTRLEHAQLFVAHWPERPTLARGPSYDLAALRDAAEGAAKDTRAALDAWTLVLEVLDAVGDGEPLDAADDRLPEGAQIREGLARFVRALDQLDKGDTT